VNQPPATATIDNRNKYGFRSLPFGHCANPGCENAACHDYQGKLICREHLPPEVLFCPFLGQQTKLWTARERYVLGGGGAGGAKTFIGSRLWLKQWIKAQAAWRETGVLSKGWSLFLRRTIPETQQVVNDFRNYYRRVDANVRWNEQQKYAEYPNGYIVQFGGMEHEHDWEKYWGGQYTLVVFDEATQFKILQIEKMDQRLRTDDSVLAADLQLYLLTNPIGGATKQWIKRKYVKPAPPEQPVYTETVLEDGRRVKAYQVYIPSNLFDNPALMESGEYEATLRRHSQATIRALLYNDWDVGEGSWVGEDWDPRYHLCIPFTLPRGMFKFKMGDYGFRARSSVLWGAVDPDDNWIIYRSFSKTGMTVEDLGRRIREIESQPLYVTVGGQRILVTGPEWDEVNDCSTVYGPMDAALWSKQGETGPSRGEVLQQMGTGFIRSNKDPDSAAEQIRSRLRRRTPTGKGDDMVAGLRFFSTAKTRFQLPNGEWDETGPIVTIPSIPIDPHNPDRWDTTEDDHDLDALGYGALSRPLSGTADEPLPPGQGVVYELLKFRQTKNAHTLPDWYSHG
jgi:hypothetical protein